MNALLDAITQTAQMAEGHLNEVEFIWNLNKEYVNAFLSGDAAWYAEKLADDFVCITSAGVCLNKQEFLALVARPESLEYFNLEDVEIQIVDQVAIIHAQTPYKYANGSPRATRYTDIWAKRDGKWQAVSAQMTPVL